MWKQQVLKPNDNTFDTWNLPSMVSALTEKKERGIQVRHPTTPSSLEPREIATILQVCKLLCGTLLLSILSLVCGYCNKMEKPALTVSCDVQNKPRK